MKQTLSFGERVPFGTKFTIAVFTLLVLACVAVLAWGMPSPFPRTDLNVEKILQHEFQDLTYVKLQIPKPNEPIKTATVVYRGERQEVELLLIEAKLVNGDMRQLIALRSVGQDDGLKALAENGELVGVVSDSWEFEANDFAALKILYPDLDIDDTFLIEVGSSGFGLSAVLALFCLLGLPIVCFPAFKRIWASSKNDALWKQQLTSEGTEFNHYSSNRNQIAKIASKFVGGSFVVPRYVEPKTSQFWTSVFTTFNMAIVVLMFTLIPIVVRNPLANIWFTLGTVALFFTMLPVIARLQELVDAWKLIPRWKVCREFKFANSPFHRYHKSALEALGFQSVGQFKAASRKEIELFMSDDKTLVVELGCLKTKKSYFHGCAIMSFLSNSSCFTTDVGAVAEKQTTEQLHDRIEPQEFLTAAFLEHVESVEEHCLNESVVIQTVNRLELESMIGYFKAVEKTELQNSIFGGNNRFSKVLNRIPRWLNFDLIKPMRQNAV